MSSVLPLALSDLSAREWIQNIIFGIGLGALYALVAIGFSLIYRTMGLLSFVHPQMVMLGSVFGYTAVATLGLPLLAAIVPVGLAAGLAGAVVDQVGIRPIRQRRGTEIALILATIGWGIVLVQLVRLTYGTNLRSLRTGDPWPTFTIASVTVRWDIVATIVVGLLFLGALMVFLQVTRLGRAVRAVGESPSVAVLMGIDVERTFAVSAFISGILGGVAGLWVGWFFVSGISAGIVGLKALAAAVVGGFGSLPGAVVGGFAVGVLETVVGVGISSSWRDAVVFGVVIVVLVLRPRGLFGKSEHVRS